MYLSVLPCSPLPGGLEGGSRPIVLPSDISSRFLSVASSNTRKNIETCGVLCGKLVSGEDYFLTNVVHFEW